MDSADVEQVLADDLSTAAKDFMQHMGVLDRLEYNKLDEAGKEVFMDRRKEEFKIKVKIILRNICKE